MNDLCKACGKPPHFGGCKVGPNTEAENKALAKHSAKRQPLCGICPSTEHETADCPKASTPRTVFLDPPEEQPCRAEMADLPPTDRERAINDLHPIMAELLMDCMAVHKTKGHDYTQGRADRLANFRRAADKWGISMKQAWGVFFGKHLDAIETYVQFGQLESEPVRGRILDAINYLLLLELIRYEEGSKQD